jgi:RNA polymerase sigma-70 factor (ECF subfamily)
MGCGKEIEVDPVSPSGDLIRQAQTGDHRAFAILLKESDKQMRSLAYRLLGSRSAMDDALQDAYLQAYRKLGDYRGTAAFSTWLHTIVYRTCLHHLRQRDQRSEVNLAIVTEPVSDTDHVDRHADADALDRALRDLTPEQAAAVLLVDSDGYSYNEAATILGVPEGTIASRLNQARQNLRTALQLDTAERRQQ